MVGSPFHAVDQTATPKNYWQDYCSTLDHSSKLSKVWSTVKSMSGVRSHPTILTLTENNICYDTNSDKAEMFARKFAAVSSDENLSDEFKTRRREFVTISSR